MQNQVSELVSQPVLTSCISHPLLVHHVARRLGISPRMVRHLAETGELRGFKVGRKIWRFLSTDVENLRARREARYD
jgi:excisionase family DNA binding protein